MATTATAPRISSDEGIEFLRTQRQFRRFTDQPVPPEVLDDLLEVARWTGSSKNSQPWEFIVVDDRKTLEDLGAAGQFSGFLASTALAIVIVLRGAAPRSEAYDEGRVAERLMLAARLHGLGSGTGWFSGEGPSNRVKALLDIPAERTVISAVGVGYVEDPGERAPAGVDRGRKPLSETVSWGRYGQRR